MPRVIVVDAAHPDPEAIAVAADVIREGGLVAFPTETVYGLGADALSADAVKGVFAAKSRPATDPLIVHVLDVAGMERVCEDVPEVARRLAASFWPGPLTVVVPRGVAVPVEVTAGRDSVAVRSPDHPVARALIAAVGRPIAAPSANLFGFTSPTTADHVISDLGDRVDVVLDGGPTTIGIESTVVDCRYDPPVVLRLGGVTVEALARWRPRFADPGSGSGAREGSTRSPGMLPKHYAPRARLVLLVGGSEAVCEAMVIATDRLTDRGRRVGLLVAAEDVGHVAQLPPTVRVEVVGSLGDPDGVARRLYGAVRAVDDDVDVILCRDFGDTGMARSVRDRLSRAADGRVVEVGSGAIESAVTTVLAAT